MQSLPKPQTRMHMTKTFQASKYVPESLMDTFKKQQEALSETVNSIADLIRESTDYKVLLSPELPARAVSVSPLSFTVRHVSVVDGTYREVSSRASQSAGKGFIEASTLNLLLSSKILTDEEKRAVLKARDLLPPTGDEEDTKDSS